MSVEERLRDARAPGEREAANRAWAIVRGATAVPQPERRRRARPALAVALAAAALALAAALTPAGASISRLVRHAVSTAPARRHVAAKPRLPARGQVLVATPAGSWLLNAGGARRRLPALAEPAWSPHGRFVAGVRHGALTVLTSTGRPTWTLHGPPVRGPAWAPDGRYLAYSAAGALHVVWGNGARAFAVHAGAGATAWAWRPGIPDSPQTFAPELAYVTRGGTLVLRHMFTGKVLWRRALPGVAATSLAWSPDGRRIVVVGRRAVLLRGADGRLAGTIPVRAGAAPRAAAVSPDSGDVALVTEDVATGQNQVLAVAARQAGAPVRTLLSRAGRLGSPTFAPDGRWLLVASGDQWLFVPTAGGSARALGPVSRLFGGAATRVAGWCCP